MRVHPFWIYLELSVFLFFLGGFSYLSYKNWNAPTETFSGHLPPPLINTSPPPIPENTFSPSPFEVLIECFTEERKRLSHCIIEIENQQYSCDEEGKLSLKKLTHPVVAVAHASGFFSEPFLIGRSTPLQTIRVFLWKQTEKRVTFHFSGDVMFGRRYHEASIARPPLIPKENARIGAESVVEHIASAYRCADIATVNLESVVSQLPPSKAYAKKRFLINSPPECVYALKKMGVNLVNLANNHINDYLQEGVKSTLRYLKKEGMAYFGAGLSEEEAAKPYQKTIRGNRIAMLSYTTVDGDAVNNKYPTSEKEKPATVPPEEEWVWEKRNWGFTASFLKIARKPRRLGDIWAIIRQYELILNADQMGKLWKSLFKVYPEIQDWVARRGHGGANLWRKEKSLQEIKKLKKQFDLVIVQFHSGFQFAEVPSGKLRNIAYRTIDAGADLVFAHHPHTLQGVEWYKGKLICFSFGNAIFDQKFFSTFDSAFLRMIWEGEQLLQARIYPVVLKRYVPVLVTNEAARDLFGLLSERSMWTYIATRLGRTPIKIKARERKKSNPVHFQIENHSVVLLNQPIQTQIVQMALKPGQLQKLPTEGIFLNQIQGGSEEVYFGRDLLKWGHFENTDCDPEIHDKIHWSLKNPSSTALGLQPSSQSQFLSLRRSWFSHRPARISPIARIALPRHRFYEKTNQELVPRDALPSYSFYFKAQKKGRGVARIRLKGFAFDDSDPTKPPVTVELPEVEIPIPIRETRSFQTFHLEIPPQLFTPKTGTYAKANFLLFFVELGPPDSELFLDDIHLIEWRLCNQTQQYEDYRFIKNNGKQELFVELTQLKWSVH